MALTINITRPYFIRSRSSGKMVDVPRGSKANGTAIKQYSYNGGVNQRWFFTPVPAVDLSRYASTQVAVTAFTFEIVPYFNREMVLDVPGGSTQYGTGIIQWSRNGGLNQRWRLVPVSSGGHVKIVSVSSGLVLDIPGFSSDDGAPVNQWADNGGQNQQWSLSEAPGDSLVGGGGGGTAAANVPDRLIGRWWSNQYKTTVDVTRDREGIKVSWNSGGEGAIWQEGNTVWMKWPRTGAEKGRAWTPAGGVSPGQVVWNKSPGGGVEDTWTKR